MRQGCRTGAPCRRGIAPGGPSKRSSDEGTQKWRRGHPSLLDLRRDRERALLHTVTRLVDLGGWDVAWDDRGLRLSHGGHALVLAVPRSLLAFLSAGAAGRGALTAVR